MTPEQRYHANEALAIKYGNRTWREMSGEGKRRLPYDDAMQAARIGLFKACHGFDPTRGFRFSTYAVRAIINEVLRELERYSRADGYSKTYGQHATIRSLDMERGSMHPDGESYTLHDVTDADPLGLHDERLEGLTEQQVDEVIASLPVPARELAGLIFYEGCSRYQAYRLMGLNRKDGNALLESLQHRLAAALGQDGLCIGS